MTPDQLEQLVATADTNNDQLVGLLHDVLAELREMNTNLECLWFRSLPFLVRWKVRREERKHEPDEQMLRDILAAAHQADEEDRPGQVQPMLWTEPEQVTPED